MATVDRAAVPKCSCGQNPAVPRITFGKKNVSLRECKSEIPFNMEIHYQELNKDREGEAYQAETLLLQGVIDCYFEEEDGIVLLDYKTDYVAAGRMDYIRERYRVQISYYARALERLTGKKVKEKMIFLFWKGEVWSFEEAAVSGLYEGDTVLYIFTSVKLLNY